MGSDTMLLMDLFQFTRPRGARHCAYGHDLQMGCFNSRAREGRDLKNESEKWRVIRFNSRAREGRDQSECVDARN